MDGLVRLWRCLRSASFTKLSCNCAAPVPRRAIHNSSRGYCGGARALPVTGDWRRPLVAAGAAAPAFPRVGSVHGRACYTVQVGDSVNSSCENGAAAAPPTVVPVAAAAAQVEAPSSVRARLAALAANGVSRGTMAALGMVTLLGSGSGSYYLLTHPATETSPGDTVTEAAHSVTVLTSALGTVVAHKFGRARSQSGLTLGALHETAVATLLDLAKNPNNRKALAAAGNGATLDFLLRAAGAPRPSGERAGAAAAASAPHHAAHALALMLEGEDTYESVLARPSAVPVLLRLVHQSGGPEVTPLGTALAFATKRARLPAAADPADVGLVVSLMHGESYADVHGVAARALAAWAEASVANCGTILTCGGGRLLASAMAEGGRETRAQAARATAALARGAAGFMKEEARAPHAHLWVHGLVRLIQDTMPTGPESNGGDAQYGDPNLMRAALEALAVVCEAGGAAVQREALQHGVLQLLRQVQGDSKIGVVVAPELRAPIAAAVGALVQAWVGLHDELTGERKEVASGGMGADAKGVGTTPLGATWHQRGGGFGGGASATDLEQEIGVNWLPHLLRWAHMYTDPALQAAGAAALAALVALPGEAGALAACQWLAYMLQNLPKLEDDFELPHDVDIQINIDGPGAPTVRVEEVIQQAGFTTASSVQDIRAAAVAAAKQLEEAMAAAAAPPPLVSASVISLLGPEGVAAYPAAAARVEAGRAAAAFNQALKALMVILASSPLGQLRVMESGGLALLDRIAGAPFDANSPKADTHRQVLRIVANMSANPLTYHALISPQPAVLGAHDWRPWIRECGLRAHDRKTIQYASRALYNLEALEAARPGEASPAIFHDGIHPLQLHPSLKSTGPPPKPARPIQLAKDLFKEVMGIDVVPPRGDTTTEAGGSGGGGDFGEGRGVPSSPAIDVVFVHGLRGGAFSTWRLTPEADCREDLESCWPTDFLSHDLPEARLLSIGYKTRFTDWGSYTLSLQDLSEHVLARLRAAGVGSRPVVFVTHSLGGLVVKQMLMDAALQEKYSHISEQVSGIVFFSTPHFGSWLAPTQRFNSLFRAAPTIDQLRSHSPHLDSLNKHLRARYHKGDFAVLSFAEGKNMPLVELYPSRGIAWRADVVPMESAYPGYGEFVVLPETDHVNICKPRSQDDTSYIKTLQFLREIPRRTYPAAGGGLQQDPLDANAGSKTKA